jgi:hypothetical protein
MRLVGALSFAALVLSISSCVFFRLPENPNDPADIAAPAYPSGSFWYDPIPGGATEDPNSAAYVERMAEEFRRPQGSSSTYKLVLVAEGGSVPVYYARPDTPRLSVPITTSGYGARGVTDVPVPPYLLPDSATDGHVVIVDPVAGIEYDFWQFRKERGRWVASAAALLDYSTQAVHEDKFSANASGFPLAAGLVWPDELLSLTPDAIDHALVFGYPLTRLDAYVEPATRSDGWMNDAEALPMGARIRLDPAYDIAGSSLTEPEKRIAEALQTYGAYLYDTGSPGSIIELNAVSPRSFSSDPYEAIPGYNPDGYLDVGNIPVDRFIVLELGTIRIWGESYPPEIAFEERYYGIE